MSDRRAPVPPTDPDSTVSPPPEWAPHEAVWLAWPSHPDLWEAGLGEVRTEFVELCRGIANLDPETGIPRGERLDVLALDVMNAETAREALEGLNARVVVAAFGDIWLRDTGPILVPRRDGGLTAHRFRFNGWGERYRLPGDEQVTPFIAAQLGAEVRGHDLVLEGGAIEVDGEGTLMTTRSCLLNPNRNPGRTIQEVEARLRAAFGVDRIVWLSRGLLNDHTDGHIDTLARFVAPGRVVCMRPSGADDPNATTLNALRAELEAATDAAGRRLQVVTIPSPGRVTTDSGTVLPASYVNFYIANSSVVVPTYGARYDQEAIQAIAALFPGRRVVGASARRLVEGGGAFHCITQQQPAGDIDVPTS